MAKIVTRRKQWGENIKVLIYGVGGGWKENIFDADLAPSIMQATSFGEVSGKKTKRAYKLIKLF